MGQFDLQAGGITFTPSKTARLGKKLTLPIHPEIEAFLLKHPTGASDDAPLFPSLASLPISGSLGASMAFRGIMECAGIAAGVAREAEEGGVGRSVSARSFHSLRHGFVTALAHANWLSSFGKNSLATRARGRAFITRTRNSWPSVMPLRNCPGFPLSLGYQARSCVAARRQTLEGAVGSRRFAVLASRFGRGILSFSARPLTIVSPLFVDVPEERFLLFSSSRWRARNRFIMRRRKSKKNHHVLWPSKNWPPYIGLS